MKFSTKLLHTKYAFDEATGASSTPIYLSSTFHHRSLSAPPEFDYTRSGNPTRRAVEEALCELEEGAGATVYASGMAAITTVFMLLSAGDHVVCSENVYGGTYRLLTSVLSRFNIKVTFVDSTDADQIRAAITPKTKAIYVETPSNPTMRITDLSAVAQIAKEHDILSIVDNTFMTPYLQRPISLGFDLVTHSATKFLGGHSDILAGVVVTRTKALAAQVKYLQNALGTVLGAQDSWLLMRGIKTLKARLDLSQASAEKIASWLAARRDISAVYYPGLSSHPHAERHSRQAAGPGAVLSFDVGSGSRAVAVLEQVKIPLVAVSLGAVESILSYPARMSHAAMPPEVRVERGITDGLLRLSVGLEDVDDLLGDLEAALDATR